MIIILTALVLPVSTLTYWCLKIKNQYNPKDVTYSRNENWIYFSPCIFDFYFPVRWLAQKAAAINFSTAGFKDCVKWTGIGGSVWEAPRLGKLWQENLYGFVCTPLLGIWPSLIQDSSLRAAYFLHLAERLTSNSMGSWKLYSLCSMGVCHGEPSLD